MNKHTHFHLFHYLILAVILLLGFSAFFFFSGNKSVQFLAIVAASIFYFLWGVFHHYLEGDLHVKIVVEYLVIALLAVFLMYGVLF